MKNIQLSTFTIRVYGLLLNAENQLLITKEIIQNGHYTKIPGGGLELGESTIDCLKREFIEEAGLDIKVQAHFHTTDIIVTSEFDATQQVIGVYYFVSPIHPKELDQLDQRIVDPNISFEWLNIKEAAINTFSFATEQRVLQLLKTPPPVQTRFIASPKQ